MFILHIKHVTEYSVCVNPLMHGMGEMDWLMANNEL